MVDGSRVPTFSSPLRPPAVRSLSSPRTLWGLTVLAMALDIALTGLGLSMGLRERNALARLFIQQFGLLGAGVLLKGAALAVGYVAWRAFPVLVPEAGRQRLLVPVGLAVPTWTAVGINTVTILAVS